MKYESRKKALFRSYPLNNLTDDIINMTNRRAEYAVFPLAISWFCSKCWNNPTTRFHLFISFSGYRIDMKSSANGNACVLRHMYAESADDLLEFEIGANGFLHLLSNDYSLR